MDNLIIGSGIIFLVPYFTTIGVVAPLKNDPILSGRAIRSFRHLKLKRSVHYFRFQTQNQDGATIPEEEEEEEQEEQEQQEYSSIRGCD